MWYYPDRSITTKKVILEKELEQKEVILMFVARVLEKGQIVIPKKARDKVKLSPGDKVEVKVTEEGIVILPFKKSYTESFKGHVKGKLSLKELEKLYAEKS
ncbi:MAG: AbrB/MazE/SpoVT family DNA-binding domain-containing protein [Deltaproteobacteria bacterium]|nr:AbrB/MazE/SpoVT family DNA-binding domain-containing protein [Deltaproteobacteria bacterium]